MKLVYDIRPTSTWPMPRKVTISAEVGVLMNSSSTPACFEYWREWARKMLRLQKPEPCVDLMPAAACAAPPIIIPGPAAMVIAVVATAPFRNLRRDAEAPDRSTLVRLGKCVQPMRSHMMRLLEREVGGMRSDGFGARPRLAPSARQPKRTARAACAGQ